MPAMASVALANCGGESRSSRESALAKPARIKSSRAENYEIELWIYEIKYILEWIIV